jgi:hypothetical protein
VETPHTRTFALLLLRQARHWPILLQTRHSSLTQQLPRPIRTQKTEAADGKCLESLGISRSRLGSFGSVGLCWAQWVLIPAAICESRRESPDPAGIIAGIVWSIANRNRPMRKMTKGRSGNMYEPTRASQHRSGDQCQECRVSIFPSFCGITSLSREAGSPSFRACKRGMGIEDLKGEEDVFDLLQSE